MEQLTFRFTKLIDDPFSPAALALLTVDDIYGAANHDLLEVLGEDRRLERKTAGTGTHGQVLGEYLSMWANTQPDGGLLVIGQENDGTFSGCQKLSGERLNDIEGAVFHCPNARVESKRVPVELANGTPDFVVLIRVFYNARMVVKDVKGRAFWRVSDKKLQMTDVQITELAAAKGEVDLEREPVAIDYPDGFELPRIRQYADAVVRMKKLTVGHTDEEILVHTRLGKFVRDKFVPNVACALLFAKDPGDLYPGCRIRFLRYEGETEGTGKNYNVVKDILIEGAIPTLITDTAVVLSSQLREFSSLGDDGRFYTVAEYPEPAWYEAIVNACVHRSYVLKNMVTFVKMFDDRLVIESPGGFPPNVTPETIYDTHSPRNPHLMNALLYLDFVKCHNEGTRRMRDAMDANNLPHPEFAQKEVQSGFNSVRVTLRNQVKLRKLWIDAEAGKILGSEKWKDLGGKAEGRILNYVAEHKSINVTQAQKLFPGSRWHRMKQLLTSMVERGLLEHHHSAVVKLDSRACFKLPKPKDGNGDKKA